MHTKTKKRIESSLAIVGLVALFTISFAPGLCWLFFDRELGNFLTSLNGHSKVLASLLQIIVVFSGIIWLATPMIVMCCIYTATKEHRYDKRSRKSFGFKPGIRNAQRLSLTISDDGFDNFIKDELDKLQNDLAERRDEYLSMYNNGPLFLTEARERFKVKMSDLLDCQDEAILSMQAELQLDMILKFRHYQQLMDDGLQNNKIAEDRSKYYSNELQDYYAELYTAFTKKIAALNSQLQVLSDEHFSTLQNLSKTLSKY